MCPVLIFRASRGVGLAIVRLLRSLRIPVSAMLRSPDAARDLECLGAHVMQGDALSRADIARAFANQPGACDVVSTLGGRAADGRYVDDNGNINVIDQAATREIGRFVLITSIGCGDMAPFARSSPLQHSGQWSTPRRWLRSTCVA